MFRIREPEKPGVAIAVIVVAIFGFMAGMIALVEWLT